MTWSIVQSDCIEFLDGLPADSVDLCLFSPPYEAARTYGIEFKLRGQAWVDWMVRVFAAAARACRGLVACVCEGQTRKYRWSAAPVLLMADLHRAGFHLRRPAIYHRVGIPGSGGPDWLRADTEYVVCTARPGRLPWSDNTACGHPPKWATGGAMSNRHADGRRINAQLAGLATGRRVTRGQANGDTVASDSYVPPDIANPGNLIKCTVGGNNIGSTLAHENEAPFPEQLAEFFVRSFCQPGGTVADPFAGSGTTAAVAKRHGRNFTGCDVRASQVALGLRRLDAEQQLLFA